MTVIDADPPYRRIATEEAWAPRELIELFRKTIAEKTVDDPGFQSLWGYFGGRSGRAADLARRIQDIDGERLSDMDATGIDMQLLLLTSPGVQIFAPADATTLASRFNDELAEAIARHPTRYAGLAAIGPPEPQKAAAELERGVKTLGLKGGVVNSHTQGEYLDDPKFWDIFAAAEALGVPIYLHPSTPPKAMIEPFWPPAPQKWAETS